MLFRMGEAGQINGHQIMTVFPWLSAASQQFGGAVIRRLLADYITSAHTVARFPLSVPQIARVGWLIRRGAPFLKASDLAHPSFGVAQGAGFTLLLNKSAQQ